MAWVKLDDQFFGHPKIVNIGKDAKLLFLASAAYCSAHLTDGELTAGAVRLLLAQVEARRAAVAELVEAGLWERVDRDYRIHDYLDYNPTAEQVRRDREQNAKRQAEWRDRHRGDDGRFTNAASNAVTAPVSNGESNTAPSPPHPVSKSSSNKESESVRRNERDPALAHPAVVAYRDVARHTPNYHQRQTIVATVEDVERWRAVVARWIDAGWKPGNVAGMLDAYSNGWRSSPNGHRMTQADWNSAARAKETGRAVQ